MKLIIAEKKSVADSIGKALGAVVRKPGHLEGPGVLITWCAGHLLEMAPPAAYGDQYKKWSLAGLPLLPSEFRTLAAKGKAERLKAVAALMARPDIATIVNACDAGREGELIFRLIYDYAKSTKPIQRLWISSMEEAAIEAGFEHLRPGADYDNLHHAALCRARADWIVGINATRLFSVIYGATLNVGRVMTPTLALLVGREAAIAAFRPEPFFTVEVDTGTFTAASGKYTGRAEAEDIRAACDGRPAAVLSVQRQEKTQAPPRLYDLTTLQRDANRLLGYTAQQTLDYAQALCEKKLATYPRTDSRFITADMATTAGTLVNYLQLHLSFAQGAAYTPDMARVVDDSKVTDHHALLPTAEFAAADLDALPTGERAVLMLIAARLLCATAPAHVYEAVTADIECAGHSFTAKGRTVLRDGWKAIDHAFRSTLKDAPRDEGDEEDAALPKLAEGQSFGEMQAAVRESATTSPRHFSEDLLLSAMASAGHASALAPAGASENATEANKEIERKGIGTPSIRAATIEKLVRGGFMERKGRQLLPTQKGTNLITVLPEVVKSPALTAEWEEKLLAMERGEMDPDTFMAGIAALVQALVREHRSPQTAHAGLFAAPKGEAVGRCPRCAGAVHGGKLGWFCADRACGFALWADNRFFAAKGKKLDEKMVAALLRDGRVALSGLRSAKNGKTYSATVVMQPGKAGDKYINFTMEFENKNSGRNSK